MWLNQMLCLQTPGDFFFYQVAYSLSHYCTNLIKLLQYITSYCSIFFKKVLLLFFFFILMFPWILNPVCCGSCFEEKKKTLKKHAPLDKKCRMTPSVRQPCKPKETFQTANHTLKHNVQDRTSAHERYIEIGYLWKMSPCFCVSLIMFICPSPNQTVGVDGISITIDMYC